MKYFSLAIIILLTVAKGFGQFQNIKIDESNLGLGPCEPSIAISPNNVANLVAGAVLNNVYHSSDTGKTWVKQSLLSKYGVYGDPCVVADKKSNFYYFHLSNPSGNGWQDEDILDRIVCQKSKDGGITWSKGSTIGWNGKKDQDKEWVSIHPKKGHLYTTWTQFDKYNSKAPEDSSLILFSRSKNKGKKWSTPVRLNQFAGNCLDDDFTVEGATSSVGLKGEIYVAWSFGDKIYFDRSFDKGKTWLEKDIVAAEGIGGWTMDIPGISRANGMPITVCNPKNGHLFICWADQRNGNDNTDIWLIKSTDKGNTWSLPKKVNNDDTKTHQFFPWFTIDPSTGNLYVVFYDRRNHFDNQTDVYLAYSKDQGNTFVNVKISASPFVPNSTIFFGDYNNISVQQGIIRPIWTRYANGKLSVWTALIHEHQLPEN